MDEILGQLGSVTVSTKNTNVIIPSDPCFLFEFQLIYFSSTEIL